MAVLIGDLSGVVDEVKAVNIINVSVLVVVDTIIRDFCGVNPLGTPEVRMLEVNSCLLYTSPSPRD